MYFSTTLSGTNSLLSATLVATGLVLSSDRKASGTAATTAELTSPTASLFFSINASASISTATSTDFRFAQSPDCTASWLSRLAEGGGVTTEIEVQTLVISQSSISIFQFIGVDINGVSHDGITLTGPTTSLLTAAPTTGTLGRYDGCCGQCSIYVHSVDVFYWPEASSNTACLKSISPYFSTRQVSAPEDTRIATNARPITARAEIPMAGPRAYTVDSDGFTYSPFAYVKFPTIEASDACGPVGGKYTSVTWSYAPGELSTVEGRLGPSKPFNFADLPCPPAAVAAADWYNYYPGERYAPIIAPVPQLYKLDPAFANCTVDIYQGYDPPTALTPQTALTPFTTRAAITQSYVTTLATPQPQLTPPGPVQTTSSLVVDQSEISVASNIEPNDPGLASKGSSPTQTVHIQNTSIQTPSAEGAGSPSHSTANAYTQSPAVNITIQESTNTAAGALPGASSAGRGPGTSCTIPLPSATAIGLGSLILSGLGPTGEPTHIPTSTATEANGTVRYFDSKSERSNVEWTVFILSIAGGILGVELCY